MKRATGLFAAGLMGLSVTALADDPLHIQILHINDHHSHLAAESFDFDVSALDLRTELADGSPIQEVEVTYGGFPLLVSLFDRYDTPFSNTLKLHAGDAITGTLYYSLFKGEADAVMMNQICFDAFELGNHEFDDGDAGLANFLDYLGGSSNCDTAVLGANVVPGPESPIQGMIEPYTIVERDGQKIGIIGIEIAQKTKVSSQPDPDTEFLDEMTTAQLYIDELEEQGINKIILLTHYQYGNDLSLAAQLSGVDVIIDGDSHTLLDGEALDDIGFPVAGPYPTQVTNADGDMVCIGQAWEYAHLLGRMEVFFDGEGKVRSCRGTPVAPIDRDFVYEDSDGSSKSLSGFDRFQVQVALAKNFEFAVVNEDSATAALLDGFNAQVEVLEQTVIGSVAEDLCLERFPGQQRSTICDPSATYANGSDISNIVAKAFMQVTPTADFAIQNGGGVRVDVAEGDFTIADAFTLLPFSNTLVTLEMTGQEIVDVLEDALSNALDVEGGSTGSYPYASGIRYDVDASMSKGARVSNVEVNPRVAGTWTSIDPGATYTVVTNDFIASGQDGYATFGEIFNAGDYVDTLTEYAQGFIDYVEALTELGLPLTKLPLDEYSTKSYVGTDGCDHATSSDCVGF
ncbi:bifunctional metallophosphatase/5'-nucleotidase [Mangrovimicrobium sediminis]|uniref:Bifunctional metallophosphatase/5'-nucleotidase n=1 Tax=Mangrovimicrobium sediminis TaxID=2562682 RepID=A0A4Z0M0Q6_9GAMM|nr:5'-nucleotidase C-terminal domain-containing protein [Haliea sp. SAOS-164]TGD73004.1 bifunctional metallophosphatase/5'-nucleotidase [Haliea sp. SAOS-164]